MGVNVCRVLPVNIPLCFRIGPGSNWFGSCIDLCGIFVCSRLCTQRVIRWGLVGFEHSVIQNEIPTWNGTIFRKIRTSNYPKPVFNPVLHFYDGDMGRGKGMLLQGSWLSWVLQMKTTSDQMTCWSNQSVNILTVELYVHGFRKKCKFGSIIILIIHLMVRGLRSMTWNKKYNRYIMG